MGLYVTWQLSLSVSVGSGGAAASYRESDRGILIPTEAETVDLHLVRIFGGSELVHSD